MKIALYPGSFDPITNGHLDIIKRGSLLFDKLIISISPNINKKNMFTQIERYELVKKVTSNIENVEVIMASDTLTVDFALKIGALFLLRGVRNGVDFDYEFNLAQINKSLQPSIETVFLIASGDNLFVSSSTVKEIVRFNGDIKNFVPEIVVEKIMKKQK